MSQQTALPIADSATTRSVFDWLERFAACVRAVDYAAARPFWHSDIISFGTYQELIRGRTRWTEMQWDNVWPRTADFAFDLDNTAVLVSADGGTATVITPWTSAGFHPDGSRFDRPGRATIILARQADGHWLGIHSHMSLQRGVPQDSHGNRPVRAR
ncbi:MULTISPECIES: YybH family protein [unclassified Bradyrhizobium]|uniref:YybH family protein n=1 Tax=unclassified Bradyrhizobium TaxID=2631580 RepID=UPI00140E4BD1|nr:nuclear transport factor 2 family protein [Bradyrhizobium sp. 2S1]MCK7673567.1 nuclear transport factor 2 family protein [Bradyrhizobium sp. 2S1]